MYFGRGSECFLRRGNPPRRERKGAAGREYSVAQVAARERDSATVRYGVAASRTRGQRKGRPGSGPLQKHSQQVVPYCVSTVPDATLSEAEPRGLKGSLRKSATVQGQCGPISRANGHRIGSPGSGPLICFFFLIHWA